jgi:hypothetical protein
MDEVYVSAFAALAGSIVGSTTSLLSAWLTQQRQDREKHLSQDRTSRQELYNQFIEKRRNCMRTLSPTSR